MFRPLLTCPAYHHISDDVPSAAAHLGVCTQVSTFDAHLTYFQANYDIVDLDTLLLHRWPRRPLLLAFDDSYRSLADTVAPMLQRRGLPGVAFLNPDMIERPVVQFDHVLSELAQRFGLDRVLGEIGPAATTAGGVQAYLNGPAVTLSRADRSRLQQRLLATFGCDEALLHAQLDLYLRPEDVQRLTDAGLEVANHTASHARCRTLDADEMAIEVTDARQRLESLSMKPVRAFSVPYGSRHDATPQMLAALLTDGNQAVFLADGRLSATGQTGMRVWDRIPMDGVGVEAMPLHLGVRPRLRSIKDFARGLTRPRLAVAATVVAGLPA